MSDEQPGSGPLGIGGTADGTAYWRARAENAEVERDELKRRAKELDRQRIEEAELRLAAEATVANLERACTMMGRALLYCRASIEEQWTEVHHNDMEPGNHPALAIADAALVLLGGEVRP